MKIHVTFEDGTSKTLDIDVTTLSEEQLDIYASMGSDEAIDELKSRIGFNPHKPLEDMTDKDVEDFSEFLKSKEASEKKDENER
jgi:hypothetical protein